MTASLESINYARIAAKAASELKASSIAALDVSERLILTEVFVVVSGSSNRHVRALVDDIEEALLKEGLHRKRREGMDEEAHWVLIDFGDLIVHVQQEEDREFYALEKLWGDCPMINLEGIETSAADGMAISGPESSVN